MGNLHKEEVRRIAKEVGLPNAERKDSQGVCFLGDIDMKEFLQHILPKKEGRVLDDKGREVGTHDGAQFYTLGERHGFRVNAKSPQSSPYYVIAKDTESNTITVGSLAVSVETHPSYRLGNMVWYSDEKVGLTARIRHRGKKYPVSVEGNTVIFEEPILVAKGQSVVFYRGSDLVGGGIVEAEGSSAEV